MTVIEILTISNNWICLISGVIFCVSYIWAGYYVLNTDKVQRFLVTLWIIFMLLSVIYLLIYILILASPQLTTTFRVTIIVLIIIADILYSVGHWIFCFQYLKSAKDIINKINGQLTDLKTLGICKWLVIIAIIVTYIISLAMEILKLRNGTYQFGDSSTVLFVLWGLVTVIVLFAAIFKIKGVINLHPHLHQSQTMMQAHLILFSVNEVLTLCQVIIPEILFATIN